MHLQRPLNWKEKDDLVVHWAIPKRKVWSSKTGPPLKNSKAVGQLIFLRGFQFLYSSSPILFPGFVCFFCFFPGKVFIFIFIINVGSGGRASRFLLPDSPWVHRCPQYQIQDQSIFLLYVWNHFSVYQWDFTILSCVVWILLERLSWMCIILWKSFIIGSYLSWREHY